MTTSEITKTIESMHEELNLTRLDRDKWAGEARDITRLYNEENAKVNAFAPSFDRLTAALDEYRERNDKLAGQAAMLMQLLGQANEREANHYSGETTVNGTETPLLRAAQSAYVLILGNAADKRAYLRARGWKLTQLGWACDWQPDQMPEDLATRQQAMRDCKPFAFLADGAAKVAEGQ